MTEQQIINELTGYMKIIEQFDKDMAQDGNALHAYLIELTNYMARANYIMAEYQRKFRVAKVQAYANLIASQQSSQKYFSATQGKDYVDAQCNEIGYIYDLSERLSRLCTHVIDAVRTIISSLKSERQFSNI